MARCSPGGYCDAWVNARGAHLLSNEANLNPNVGANIQCRHMRGETGR